MKFEVKIFNHRRSRVHRKSLMILPDYKLEIYEKKGKIFKNKNKRGCAHQLSE